MRNIISNTLIAIIDGEMTLFEWAQTKIKSLNFSYSAGHILIPE